RQGLQCRPGKLEYDWKRLGRAGAASTQQSPQWRAAYLRVDGIRRIEQAGKQECSWIKGRPGKDLRSGGVQPVKRRVPYFCAKFLGEAGLPNPRFADHHDVLTISTERPLPAVQQHV